MKNLNPIDKKFVRESIIDIILSTDMTKHKKFCTGLDKLRENKRKWERSHENKIYPLRDLERNLLLEMAVHFSDISNVCKRPRVEQL